MFCRLCGKKENDECVSVLNQKDKSLSKKIKTVLNIQIRSKDEYQKICIECNEKVENFFNYYEEVQKTQTDLRRHRTKERKRKTESFVQIRPKVELEDSIEDIFFETDGIIPKPEVIIDENITADIKCSDITIKDETIDYSDGVFDEIDNVSSNDDDADENIDDSKGDVDPKRKKYRDLSEKINKFFDYTCKKCDIDLGNPFGYQLHMKRKHGIRDATITCCGEKIPSIRNDLIFHYYQHTDSEKLNCRYCGKKSTSLIYLRQHERNHAERLKPDSRIPCPECGKSMNTKASLRNHMKNFHRSKEDATQFECHYCGKLLRYKTSLRVHFRVAHNIHIEVHPRKPVGEPVLCPVCAKSFQSESGFQCHFKAHHDIQKVICPDCGKEVNKMTLKNHYRRLHDLVPQSCDICFKPFRNAHAVLHHKNRVHIAPRHECDLCEKKFKTKDKLKDHRRGHFVENRFHCDMCSVTCNDYSNILKHRKQVHQAAPLPKGMGRKILEVGY